MIKKLHAQRFQILNRPPAPLFWPTVRRAAGSQGQGRPARGALPHGVLAYPAVRGRSDRCRYRTRRLAAHPLCKLNASQHKGFSSQHAKGPANSLPCTLNAFALFFYERSQFIEHTKFSYKLVRNSDIFLQFLVQIGTKFVHIFAVSRTNLNEKFRVHKKQ